MSETVEEALALLHRYADDDEADVLERLMIKAGLRWQCKAARTPGAVFPCNWVNRADDEACESCGTPKTTEWVEDDE